MPCVPNSSLETLRHTKLACASCRYGGPSEESPQEPTANRASPLTLPLQSAEISACEACRMLMQKLAPSVNGVNNPADLFTQMSMEGGSMLSSFTAVAVIASPLLP